MNIQVSGINVIVGSTNPNKCKAALGALERLYPQLTFRAYPFSADPGITHWESCKAPGQPFGLKQTAFGAIHRMNDCWKNLAKIPLEYRQKTIVVGLENGLVRPKAVGQKGSHWFDVCFIATRNDDPGCSIIIKRGSFVPTEFEPGESFSQEEFDNAVVDYHELIMPKIEQKVDLYLDWTKSRLGGPFTRAYYLQQCFKDALGEQTIVKSAYQIVGKCVENGMTASAGDRYRSMLWTRDLAYMASVYIKIEFYREFLNALRHLKAAQFNNHELYNNGYETFNRFGNLPIVCIPEENMCDFLQLRIRGTMENPSWQILLWQFCERMCPELLVDFPLSNPESKEIEEQNLDTLTYRELLNYYHILTEFENLVTEKIAAEKEPIPKASFALRKYIASELENLTPGTRDSEIHFIRAIFSFIKLHPHSQELVLDEFSESIAHAIFYMYMNVIDNKDGLPKGSDSRDIFADILYDSKVLTNAVFWYQALDYLVEYAELMNKTKFTSAIAQALEEQKRIGLDKEIPQILVDLTNENYLNDGFQEELNRLRVSIQTQLLFNENEFEPRDFLPGSRAAIALDHPINPTPIDHIIKRDNPTFIDGKTVDCQSLAHAVLTGLIDKCHYDKVIDLFKAADSTIGVQVFVPISGRNEKEALLLSRVKGQVVWPHVSWSVVSALIAMGTEESLNFAEEQRDKLMALGRSSEFGGCSEWYAIDPDTSKPVRGGETAQGWAATSMITAIDDFYRYYSAYSK